MKSKLFIFNLIVIVLMMVTALSGCTPPQAEAPAEEPAATEAAEAPAEGGEAAPTTMDFTVWSYGIETIQDNIKKFHEMNPGITVNLKDFSWLDYHDTMVGQFAAGSAPELLYGSDHWLQEWASAGWLQPLDDLCPNVAAYNQELAPYAKEGMTYDGKTYGLSYYADTMDFVYNEDLLSKAGITEGPKTWEDVYTMSKALKDQGIVEYPIIMAWSQKEGAFPEAFISMVYSQHEGSNALFDNDLNPVFNQAGSAASQVLEWLKKSYDEGLLDPASLTTAEIDQVKSMQAGQHAFTIFPQYNMAEVNKPESGEYAGKFKIALMPGKSHNTVGYVRFYAMTPKTVDEGKVEAACKFLDYFGGKTDGEYAVVKRWAVENGLGFAQLPLFDDPDVQAAFGKWGDVATIKEQAKLARAKEGLTTWYGAWDVYARAEIHKAILGEQDVQTTLDNMANKWNELKAQG
jgi:multiple sugar transport system substrate-binding protein